MGSQSGGDGSEEEGARQGDGSWAPPSRSPFKRKGVHRIDPKAGGAAGGNGAHHHHHHHPHSPPYDQQQLHDVREGTVVADVNAAAFVSGAGPASPRRTANAEITESEEV